MAAPFKSGGVWRAKVKDAAGRWQQVRLQQARTKKEAEELAADLAMRYRRQREGLEPLASDAGMTLKALLKWWLTTYSAAMVSHRRTEGRYRVHLESSALALLPLRAVTAGRIESFLQAKASSLSAASLNQLRALIRTAFNAGRRAGLCIGQNPATDVKPRRVPKRKPTFLEAHEVAPMLANVPDRWRAFFACAVYTGLRKGELIGLRKRDVDLRRRLLTVGRSYDRDTTKGGHEDVIPIALELVPYLEAALQRSRGELLFPGPDGEMRSEETPLGDVLARAMKHAGLVLGYKHMCRWCKKTRPHEEEHLDCEPRHCPQCERKLWPKAIKRTLRFHDLRHTTASLLLAAGVDLFAVQKILRHTDPKVTSEVYAHLVPGYLHGAVDKLVLAPRNDPEKSRPVTADPAGFGAPMVRGAEKGRSVQSVAPRKIQTLADLERRAWQESNLRPAASKAAALSS